MKAHLRREMKARLEAMPEAHAAGASGAACALLMALPEFTAARAVMLYHPIPGEVDCVPVAEAAWQAGKTVLLPRVTWEKRYMVALPCASLTDEHLRTGRHGLREPTGETPFPPGRIDLIVVPALAFDERGNRLGRGGGFYDRFLAQPDCPPTTCGLAFELQVVGELPVGHHDRPVEILVTDRRVRRFNRCPDRQARHGRPAAPTPREESRP